LSTVSLLQNKSVYFVSEVVVVLELLSVVQQEYWKQQQLMTETDLQLQQA